MRYNLLSFVKIIITSIQAIQKGWSGVRSVVILVPSAFLSSAAFTLILQSAILGGNWSHPDVGHLPDVWCLEPCGTLHEILAVME